MLAARLEDAPSESVKYSTLSPSKRETRMPVGKIIELVGTSSRGFEDAINEAVRRSAKTVKNIRGVDVVGQKVIVKEGKVTEYRVNLKLSFGVE